MRADASLEAGTGHLARALALAEAWKRHGGTAALLSSCDESWLRQRAESTGVDLVRLEESYPDPSDLETTLRFSAEIGASWVALDGYGFDSEYQQAVRAAGVRLLVIDDVAHLSRYHAEILLNQNINAEEVAYNHDPDTTLLLGTAYALLRSEFLARLEWSRKVSVDARKVLVTMGGSDSQNTTRKVIDALQEFAEFDLEVQIAVGQFNPNLAALERAVQRSATKIKILTGVSRMSPLMAWADVAITAGGSTCWELAFMGLPAIILECADNQKAIARGMDEDGAAVNLGWHAHVGAEQIHEVLAELLSSPQRREQMALRGPGRVDGLGSDRVVSELAAQLG